MSLTSNSRRWFTRVLCLGACLLPALGSAADYPTRPITIVVGYSPGGANDVLARIVAEKASSCRSWTATVMYSCTPAAR